jgi:hypothetical protein
MVRLIIQEMEDELVKERSNLARFLANQKEIGRLCQPPSGAGRRVAGQGRAGPEQGRKICPCGAHREEEAG